MKRFLITEEEKLRILNLHKMSSEKYVISEDYEGGLVMQGDKICDIVCKNKYAGVGSKGDIVKMIQHLLSNNGFGGDYYGGGMYQGCQSEYPSCDGDYKTRTKSAVIYFQTKNGLSADGVVGYNTHKAMCDKLKFTNSLTKATFCPTCKCENNQNQNENPTNQEIIPEITDQITNFDCEKIKKCLVQNIFDPTKIISCLYGEGLQLPGGIQIPGYPGPGTGTIPGGDQIPQIPDMGKKGCDVCKYLSTLDDNEKRYIDVMPKLDDPLYVYRKQFAEWCKANCSMYIVY